MGGWAEIYRFLMKVIKTACLSQDDCSVCRSSGFKLCFSTLISHWQYSICITFRFSFQLFSNVL